MSHFFQWGLTSWSWDLPKQCPQVGTRCSNTWACGRHFTPKPHICIAEALLKEWKELDVIMYTCGPSIWEIGTEEIQGYPRRCSEFKTSLGYMKPLSKREGQGWGWGASEIAQPLKGHAVPSRRPEFRSQHLHSNLGIVCTPVTPALRGSETGGSLGLTGLQHSWENTNLRFR